MSITQTFMNNVIDNKLGKDDKEKVVNLKCQVFIMANRTTVSDGWSTRGPKYSLSCRARLVCFWSRCCCLSVDDSWLRCRNPADAGLQTSACWDTGTAGLVPGLLLCVSSGARKSYNLERAVSKTTRGYPKVTILNSSDKSWCWLS